MRVMYIPTFKFINSKKEIACLLSFFFAILSVFIILKHERAVNFHCVLFGTISERERTFTEGSLPLCVVFILTEVIMALFSLGLWLQTRKEPDQQL